MTVDGKLSILFEDYGYTFISLDVQGDYRVKAKLVRSAGEIVIKLGDLGYEFGFNGNSCWGKFTDGDIKCITDTTDLNEKVNIQIDVKGSEYVAYIDGFEIQRISLPGNTNDFSMAIWCQSGFPCPTIDDFKLEPLQ